MNYEKIMYTIHTTPGFIIESRPRGEAGKLLSIFTRDLGLVLATAQGIRLEKSKLRYHSQEYSFGEFSFVRGKEFWRLTNAGKVQGTSDKVQGGPTSFLSGSELRKASKNETELISRIALLLRRLLRGEEAHPELFDHIESAVNFLKSSPEFTSEQSQTLESIIVFRILHLLGYVGIDKKISAELISQPLSIKLIDEAVGQRMVLNQHINKALRESHL